MEEGSVKVLDTRIASPNAVVTSWRDFGDAWVVGAGLRYDRTIIAGGSSGRLQFYDLRSRTITKTIESGMDMTAFDIAPNLPYVAA